MQFEKIDLNDYNATGIFQSLIRVFRQISGCDVRRAGLVLLVLLGWCLVSSGARADAGGLSGQDIAIYKQAFAAVSKEKISAWTSLMHAYLRGRAPLARVYVLVDGRHGLKPPDLEMMDLLDKSAMSYQVVLTKKDEVKKSEIEPRLESVRAALARRPAAHPEVLFTSSDSGEGVGDLREGIGNHVYGCDDCQLICPWNKFAVPATLPDFDVRNGLDAASLIDLFNWTEHEFNQRLEGSPIRRIGHERWLRNLAVALGNALRGPLPENARAPLVAALRARMENASALVREHVAWALDA